MAQNKVRFIRKNGKVIPIRVKEGSGSRGGSLKAERNAKQKVGTALIKGATAGYLFGSFGPLVGTGAYVLGVKKAGDTIAGMHKFRDLKKSGASKAKLDKLGRKIRGSFKAQRVLHGIGRAMPSARGGIKIAAAGMGAAIAGIALKSKGNKERAAATRSRMLEKKRKRK